MVQALPEIVNPPKMVNPPEMVNPMAQNSPLHYVLMHLSTSTGWRSSPKASIRELCESCDSEYTNFFDRNESRKLIDFLCTTYTHSYYLLCMY